MQIPALTITQPYATLITIGAKRIETRGWATKYRGPIAIHAGQGLGPVGGKQGLAELIDSEPFFRVLCQAGIAGRSDDPETVAERLPRGAVVAIARLYDCAPITDDGILTQSGRLYPESPEHEFGDYSPGRYAWLLADIRRLPEPIPARGGQGLWRWDVPEGVEV